MYLLTNSLDYKISKEFFIFLRTSMVSHMNSTDFFRNSVGFLKDPMDFLKNSVGRIPCLGWGGLQPTDLYIDIFSNPPLVRLKLGRHEFARAARGANPPPPPCSNLAKFYLKTTKPN